MHNAAIAHLGVDYAYLPFLVQPALLKQAIDGFAAIGLQGFNITIPHKQAIIPFLADIDPIAQSIGAVNTVWRTEKGWKGTNTDVTGFIHPLTLLARDWSQTTAVILGNGGAARAVVAGCVQLGCAAIHVVGRDAQKLEDFLHSWADMPTANVHVHTWAQLQTLLPQTDLLVNTTPIGMSSHEARSPLSAKETDSLRPNVIAYDLIYTPSPTVFLQQATERGAIAIDGLEMLIQQGAAALEIWLQQPAPVAVMRHSLKQQLGIA